MQINLITDFDMGEIVAKLVTWGGVSFPILTEDTRQALADVALGYTYVRRQEIAPTSGVRQDLSGFDSFEQGNPFLALRDMWQLLLQQKAIGLGSSESDLFSPPLCFNELSLQRYEIGSTGISTHQDLISCKNLVCIFNLLGTCRFVLCRDRAGNDPYELSTQPGNVILMVAPGFRGQGLRPFHFLSDIHGPRISFGLRQNTRLPEGTASHEPR